MAVTSTQAMPFSLSIVPRDDVVCPDRPIWFAANRRHDIFSTSQKRELEQLLIDSKEFRHLFLDRDKGRSGGKSGTGQAGASGGSREHKADGRQGQQRVPLQRGQPQQEQRLSGSQQQQDRTQGMGQAPHSMKSDGLQV